MRCVLGRFSEYALRRHCYPAFLLILRKARWRPGLQCLLYEALLQHVLPLENLAPLPVIAENILGLAWMLLNHLAAGLSCRREEADAKGVMPSAQETLRQAGP